MTISRTLGRGLLLGSAVLALGVGCLARPVTKQDPTTKVNFTTVVKSQAIDKVDLLLAIDNSGSMGDKQAILAKAIPDLVGRLINPECVDADKKPTGKKADPLQPPTSQCPAGTEPEFKPVVDLHLGIVSSSLGGLGSTSCAGDANNDHGRLIARSFKTKGSQAANVEPSGFFSWFPKTQANEGKTGKGLGDQTLLINSFQDAVQGTDQTGCGLEAQLESFYHFLVQPDPWDSIKVEANKASYQGIDETILQQRKDFLRPDSLVAIIMLTDEDDSSADPLSIGGQGWAFMDQNFPGSKQARSDGVTTTAPRGTSPCDAAPTDAKCTSCGFAASNAEVAADANCKNNNGYYGADEDSLNVRFFKMKQRYGVDPQYPIKRYVDGLRNRKVPNSASEHEAGSGKYLGTAACINPLFAKNLPASSAEAAGRVKDTDAKGNKLTDQQRINSGLCNLEPGPRSADLVFFAIVGGVPNDLLFDNASTDNPVPKTRIEFTKLVGTAPDQYNYSGQDPHMVQSLNPREGLPAPDKIGSNGSDPAHGREWDTRRPSATGVTEERDDLQFACTFPLEAPLGAPRPCTDPKTCDCDGKKSPPLCGGPGNPVNTDPKTQIRAKAYPTIRQFTLAKLLGDQGIVGSLCPLVDGKGKLFAESSEFFGYRPAVRAIIDRLKNALAQQCLPQPLTPDDKNEVPCLILETLANPGGQEVCDTFKDSGLSQPSAEVFKKFREQQLIEFPPPKPGSNDYDVTKYPVCQVAQIAQTEKGKSCAKDPRAGWCYVVSDGKTGGQTCPQAILFSERGNPQVGARVSLQCIQQFGSGVAAGDKPTTP